MLRDRRLELIEAQLTIQQQSLANLRAKHAQFEKQASRFQPRNKEPDALPMPEELALDLQRSTSDIGTQQQNLEKKRLERETDPRDIRRGHQALQGTAGGRAALNIPQLPELPNPAAPRADSSNSVTTSSSTWTTGTMIICAIRSPGEIVNGWLPRFQTETITWPW